MNNNGFDKIKNFEELLKEKEIKGNKNYEEKNHKIKNVTFFLHNIKDDILSCCENKGVALSTHKISGIVGVDKKDVEEILIKLENENKITKKIIGENYYWKIK
jgi:hypothetical protein